MQIEMLEKMRGQMPSGAHTEMRAQVNTSASAVMLDSALITNTRSESSGVSARVCERGVCGFASVAECSEQALRDTLRAASENAHFMAENAPKGENVMSPYKPFDFDDGVTVQRTEQRVYVDFARQLDEYIRDKYPALASRQVRVTADCMDKYLITSSGTRSHTAIPRVYVYTVMKASTDDGTPVSLFDVSGGFGSFEEHFSDIGKVYERIDKQYEDIMKKREGVYPSAGLKTCILGGSLSGMLAHEAVGHTVEADLVLGGSVAAHNVGRAVASPLVSMVDFANTAYGERAPLPVYVDDEGTPAEDVMIIENGILKSFMHNISSAEHFGARAQGNARAFAFSDEPLIRMRNTAILKGESRLQDMIASVEDGYYFTATNNGQADTSGEFMFGVCMGYEIKNGRLARPLLDTTISGVAFDMLKTVDMVSDTMEWSSSGFCGKKQRMPVGLGGPAIRCKITVGGR